MKIYAECPVHGAFETHAISIGGDVERLTLHDNLVDCPRCGRMSRMMDGVFSVTGEVLELIQVPSWTRQLLRRVQDSVQTTMEKVDASSEALSVLDAISDLRAEIKPINAKLEQLLAEQTVGQPRRKVKRFLRIFWAALSGVVLLRDGGDLGRDVITWVTEQVEAEERESPAIPSTPAELSPARESQAPGTAPTPSEETTPPPRIV